MRSSYAATLVLASILASRSADARELLVADGNRIIRLDATSGAPLGVFSGPEMHLIEGMAFGPDGKLYVSDYSSSTILKYDGTTFAFLGVFRVGPELQAPMGLTFGPNGRLYVASQGIYGVLTYDLSTGQPVDMLPAPLISYGGYQGLGFPPWMTFPSSVAVAADGTIYLAGGQKNSDLLLRKRPLGAFETFIQPSGCDGSFDVVVAPDGNLFVSDDGEGNVCHVDATTGVATKFISGGSNNSGLALAANDSLYNYDFNYPDLSVRRYDLTGALLGTFATGGTMQPPQIAWAFIALSPTGNSPAGPNVAVSPASGLTVTFSNVTVAGNTTVSSTAPTVPLPTSFKAVNTFYFDLQTTAVFTGTITVCQHYDDTGMSVGQEKQVSLVHLDAGVWVNTTTSLDTVANVVCGTVTHLSPFGLATHSNRLHD